MSSDVIKSDVDGQLDNPKEGERSSSAGSMDNEIVLRVQGHWWMVGTAFFALLFAFAMGQANSANKRVAENVRTVVVKLSPDGGHHVEFHNEDAEPEAYASTINAGLRKAMEARFRRHPGTITADFTKFSWFLSPRAYNLFMDSSDSGFDAMGKINRVEAGEFDYVRLPVFEGIFHKDKDYANAVYMADDVFYETTLYYHFDYRSPNSGLPVSTPDSVVFNVKWQFDSNKLKRSNYSSEDDYQTAVFENPIGISIFEYSKQVTGGAR